jgi:hypothetical protein
MDLFVTLNVAPFKNILCIPIVCKYFIFVVSMEIRKKNSSHVAIRNLKLNDIKSLLVVIYEKDKCEPDHNHSELCSQKSFLIVKINQIKAALFVPPYLEI